MSPVEAARIIAVVPRRKVDSMSKGGVEGGVVDPETIELLGALRKGKPLAYAFGLKGGKVDGLILKKKRLSDGELAKAGRGATLVFGVVKGQAANVTFYLARKDGYTELPGEGKTDKLKTYLNELTKDSNQKWSPVYSLVDELPQLEIDEADAKHPLVLRFKSLETAIVQVLDAQPQLQGEISQRSAAISKLLSDPKTIGNAATPIDELSQFLQRAFKQGVAVNSDAQNGAEPNDAIALAEALKRLKPDIDKAIEADATRKTTLFGAMAKIAGLIKSKEFEPARTDLDSLRKQLASFSSSPSQSDSSSQIAAWQERCSVLEPRLLSAQKLVPDRATKLGAVWTYANEQANAGNFKNANAAADRLEGAVDEILAAATKSPVSQAETLGVPEGIVASRLKDLEKFFQERLAAIKSAAGVEISQLGAAMDITAPEEAEGLEQGLQDYLDEVYAEAHDALLNAARSGDIEKVQAAIAEWRGVIAEDEVVKQLQESVEVFDTKCSVSQQFETLFDDALSEAKRLNSMASA